MRNFKKDSPDNSGVHHLFFEDLGRPLVDKAFMAKLTHQIGKLATSHDFDMIYRQTPSITYIIGTEIKHARRSGSRLTSDVNTTDDVIENLKNNGILSPLQTDKGMQLKIESFYFKSFGDGRRDVRVRLRDIPRIDGFGSVIYDERRIVQSNLGLPYARDEINQTSPLEEMKSRSSISLMLGTMAMPKNRPFDLSISMKLNEQLSSQNIVIGKLSAYDAFKPAK